MSKEKSKLAFGSEANIDAAIKNELIDALDILFLDEHKIGWIDENGKIVIANDYLEEAIDLIDQKVFSNTNTIDALRISIQEGGETANLIADAKKAGTDASDAVISLENGKVADLRTDVDTLKAVSYVEITADEIDAMFETA